MVEERSGAGTDWDRDWDRYRDRDRDYWCQNQHLSDEDQGRFVWQRRTNNRDEVISPGRGYNPSIWLNSRHHGRSSSGSICR
jgi:hypothetical protein